MGRPLSEAMRILIDILHPAHVHFFRNFYHEMASRGHELFITARAKDHSLELLSRFGLPFHHLSDQRSGRVAMALELAQRTGRLLKLMREFRPDVMTGIMGPTITLAGALRRVPAVVFYDTEHAVQTNWFVYPLATASVRLTVTRGGSRAPKSPTPGIRSSPTSIRTGSNPIPPGSRGSESRVRSHSRLFASYREKRCMTAATEA